MSFVGVLGVLCAAILVSSWLIGFVIPAVSTLRKQSAARPAHDSQDPHDSWTQKRQTR